MKKETIEKIIANNRRPFAVHQIWAEVDRLETTNAKQREALKQIYAWWDAKDGHLTTHFSSTVTKRMESLRPLEVTT